MKTAICFYSKHHGNTKKLLDAITAIDPDANELRSAVDFYKGLK